MRELLLLAGDPRPERGLGRRALQATRSPKCLTRRYLPAMRSGSTFGFRAPDLSGRDFRTAARSGTIAFALVGFPVRPFGGDARVTKFGTWGD